MNKVILIIATLTVFLLGCQSAPRYSGAKPRDEGSRAKPLETIDEFPTAIDPIAMGKIIDRYLGKPYAGQHPEVKGLDCSEFVGEVYLDYASIHLPRTTENLWKTGKIVKKGSLTFGDLVFFDTGGRGVSHVGIYVGFNEFVHASQSNGIIISNLEETYYRKRYIGARRVME
ncbi:MAG: NlpC/P60 family protein [Candidatus Zixiibacteriota bacterium]